MLFTGAVRRVAWLELQHHHAICALAAIGKSHAEPVLTDKGSHEMRAELRRESDCRDADIALDLLGVDREGLRTHGGAKGYANGAQAGRKSRERTYCHPAERPFSIVIVAGRPPTWKWC